MGISVGATALIAQYFGAGKYEMHSVMQGIDEGNVFLWVCAIRTWIFPCTFIQMEMMG